ncbi:hypothetical protein [Oceaniovalibus guishaninsula]|nr:hypothetical protein [Oceaniovalibus guishaninsula]
MAHTLTLEDFGSEADGFNPELVSGQKLEAERLQAFDTGYAAGWDDATKAAEQEARSAEDVARARLQDLGFTYHEARAHVMLAMTPLLEAIVAQVLPALIRDTIGARILEEFGKLAEHAGDTPVDLLVPEGEVEAMRAAVEGLTALPLNVRAEDSLPGGHIYLRLGETERQIDLSGVAERLTTAIAALDTLNKDALHG